MTEPDIRAPDAEPGARFDVDPHFITRVVGAAYDRDAPELRRLLGVEGDLGRQLGLPDDFVVRVVKAVGSYGELFDRHVGPASRLGLERGPNRLWNQGGLHFSPPFR